MAGGLTCSLTASFIYEKVGWYLSLIGMIFIKICLLGIYAI